VPAVNEKQRCLKWVRLTAAPTAASSTSDEPNGFGARSRDDHRLNECAGGITLKRDRASKVVSSMAALGLALSAMLIGGPAVASGGTSPAPPPENLRLEVGDDGVVDFVRWDPPSGSSGTLRYDVNYRFANTANDDVFWATTNTFLSPTSFGHFVECGANHRPDEEWIINITYWTPDGPSLPTDAISMCFP